MAHSPGCAQGVSLTSARERGQLVFLEGLRSAVDTFFQAEGEAPALRFLRSVRRQPSPGPAGGRPGAAVASPSVCGRSEWLRAGHSWEPSL